MMVCRPQSAMHDSKTRSRLSVGAITVIAALLVTVGAAQSDTFADVMRRAHEYVVVYEDHELSSVMASEHYHQQLFDRFGQSKVDRVLRSDYLIVQLPPQEDWFALRDVYEVDGMPISDRAARFRQLFAGPRATVTDRAMEIAAENARFNLGDIYRTINVPTFALRLLRPMSRGRSRYQKTGEEQIESTHTWVVNYEETRGPTFSATRGGRDLPAHGRFWIEPDTGVVVRSEMILGGTRQLRDRATITVTYGLEPSLGFRVPVEMRERYDRPDRKNADVIVAVATYSGFRRFDLRTLTKPDPPTDEPDSKTPPPVPSK
jgi:hypothetical protein